MIPSEADGQIADNRRQTSGNEFTNIRRRSVERPPLPRWQQIAKVIARGVGASVLLAGGTIWTLNQQKPKFLKPGDLLRLPASVVQAAPPLTEQVSRVSSVLRRYTKDTVRADRIAAALVREGGKRNLDPALLVGLLIAENAKLDPTARSNVSARGIMQIMPFHAGKWKDCPSTDLVDVDSNICYGTSILAQYIKKAPNLEKALLRYNGCVRGTNTRNCHTYSGKVLRYADKAASQMLSASFSPVE